MKPLCGQFLSLMVWLVMVKPGHCSREDDMWDLAQANSDFGYRLYKELARDETIDNIFFSPFSISTAFGMTYLGANDDTYEEIGNVMGFALFSDDDIHETFYELAENIMSGDHNYTLRLANRLFGQETFHFLPNFLNDVEEFYAARPESLDFQGKKDVSRKHINKWVSEQTEGNIKELLPDGSISSSTIIVLVNAIYFKGTWVNQFKPEDTTKEPFLLNENEQDTVDMMHITENYLYGENSDHDCKILEIPYEGNDVMMYVILPNEINGLKRVEQEMSADELDDMIDDMRRSKVRVTFPKFRITQHMSLKEKLQGMGMMKTFDLHEADFSGMDGKGGIVIDDVIHQAFVEVDEEGTRAAAATGVIGIAKSAGPMVFDFRVDRPFMFLIREKHTGTTLFLGRVINPATTVRTARSTETGSASSTTSMHQHLHSFSAMLLFVLASVVLQLR